MYIVHFLSNQLCHLPPIQIRMQVICLCVLDHLFYSPRDGHPPPSPPLLAPSSPLPLRSFFPLSLRKLNHLSKSDKICAERSEVNLVVGVAIMSVAISRTSSRVFSSSKRLARFARSPPCMSSVLGCRRPPRFAEARRARTPRRAVCSTNPTLKLYYKTAPSEERRIFKVGRAKRESQ